MPLGIRMSWGARSFHGGCNRLSSIPRASFPWPPLLPLDVPPASATVPTQQPCQRRLRRYQSTTSPGSGQAREQVGGDRPAPAPDTTPAPTPRDEGKEALTELIADDADADVSQLAKNMLQQSILVRPLIRYDNKRVRDASLHEHMRSLRRQLNLDNRRQERELPPVDWRETLSMLYEWTRQAGAEDWTETALQISIPEQEAGKLTPAILRYLLHRTGCLAELRPGHPSTLYVAGDDRQIILYLHTVSWLVSNATIQPITNPNAHEIAWAAEFMDTPAGSQAEGEPLGSFLAKIVPNRRRYGQAYELRKHVNEIPLPDVHSATRTTFLAYISRLADANIPPMTARHLYGSQASANQAITEHLLGAFRHECPPGAMSNLAIRRALACVIREGALAHSISTARQLLLAASIAGVNVVGTLNILLEGSVRGRDLGNFQTLLRLRQRTGQDRPNFWTWLRFLRLIQSHEVKLIIVETMEKLGYRDIPGAWASVVPELAEADTQAAIDSGSNVATFLQSQEAKYGPDWLSKATLVPSLKIFAKHGKFAECIELVQAAYRVNIASENDGNTMGNLIRVDAAAVTLILRACEERKSTSGALATLVAVQLVAPNLRLDHKHYKLLFQLAWKCRRLNFAAVVWHYACVNRMVDVYMRNMVVRRVQQALEEGGSADKGKGFPWSRFFIPSLVDQKRPRLLADYATGVTKEMNCDAAYRRCTPTVSLTDMLCQAWAWDTEFWKAKTYAENLANGDATTKQPGDKKMQGSPDRPVRQEPGRVHIPLECRDSHNQEVKGREVVFDKAVYRPELYEASALHTWRGAEDPHARRRRAAAEQHVSKRKFREDDEEWDQG